eukprot:CAMPEP_0176236466 /NCGR_PEP_ID=MMETSP0121_2-20121125/27356_1 /TAXON_ID=160619 /ORGANISM="Kryptoperidinium foliaceum, Strain CCMP 1326" /LENGTH=357 /DNA_ID=CAMNT_0017575895 /DNA_START=1 /DNA_END=1074 /DNA_ORIENTATION=+
MDAEAWEALADAEGGCTGRVSRRRRFGRMQHCRRRHASPGWLDRDAEGAGWKCDEHRNAMYCDPGARAEAEPSRDQAPLEPEGGDVYAEGRSIGWPSTGYKKAEGLWCEVPFPPRDWRLKQCNTVGSEKISVRTLTYNLFWWNLFDRRDGDGRKAGKLIATTSWSEPYDFMAFQECDDRWRILRDAIREGLPGEYDAIDGGKALAIAYRTSLWELLVAGFTDVGEDDRQQYYGKRRLQWARFRHRSTGKTAFVANHHGPLPISVGGGCAGSACSLNIMRAIAENAHLTDAIILTGDFNAGRDSSRFKELANRLHHVYTGTAMGGIDHFFSNCAGRAAGHNLGNGGSDHDALSVTLNF